MLCIPLDADWCAAGVHLLPYPNHHQLCHNDCPGADFLGLDARGPLGYLYLQHHYLPLLNKYLKQNLVDVLVPDDRFLA